MTEYSGKLEQWNRIVMNYYGVTDEDFENDQEIFIDDGKVIIYNKDGMPIKNR